MAKSNKRSSLYRRPFLIIIIILLIALTGLAVAKMFVNLSVQNDSNTENITNANSEQEFIETEEPLEEEDKPEIIQNEGENPNTLESLTGSITTARVSGQKVIIRINLDQYLSSGVCSLVMNNGSKTYSATANIINSASTSTCEGFDVPVSELSSGTWLISIGLSSGGKTGNITGEVSL